MCYYSFWIERAPSNWQHKKNWSQLMQNFNHTGSPEESELPLFAMALTDSISKDTLSDWLYKSVPDRPMDVVITFFEQVRISMHGIINSLQLLHIKSIDTGCCMFSTQ